jgi:poly-gamma-glutamate synthesis protein (capsule biosynthesis protein)
MRKKANMSPNKWLFGLILSLSLMYAACSSLQQPMIAFLPQAAESSKTPFQPVSWTLTPSPLPGTPTPTPPPYSIWIASQIPEEFHRKLNLPPDYGYSEQVQGATLRVEISDAHPISHWIYALVAPFWTLTDGIASEQIAQVWAGKPVGVFDGSPLMMDESTLKVFSAFWGEPAAGSTQVVPSDQIIQTAWNQHSSWAIVPFEALQPRWKVLEVDGISPIHKSFEHQGYALTVPISVQGDAPNTPVFPTSNRDPNKMTTLVMTGVTALVRATAYTMERQGVTYPAKDIRGWLQEADITHISNEVPFAEDCPYPNPVQEGMRFCSDSRYIKLLEYVGTDIIELTGDHFSDWGPQAMYHTLELYDQHSWPYYGGGENLKEGRQAVTLSHNGNQLAFIGCNAKGGGYAQATNSKPGAVACDFAWMQAEISRLRNQGFIPIATFQHFEYYTYTAQPNQKRDAQILTGAGAAIVSGSQAHHPQGFEFSNGGFVHHGLGNLFFDQFDISSGTRQGFIDRHVFYNGRHISTELLTIWFVDYARARPMTQPERESLLKAVFNASDW